MLARPPETTSSQVAHLSYDERAVSAWLNEREERFVKLLRGMGYQWVGRAWVKRITALTGPARERAAELGRALLAAGYAVDFPDADTTQAAITGAYTPEQRCWILRRVDTAGDYPGWFYIQWPRDGDNFYTRAMRIPGARYCPPCVAVPPERYNEILDFADIHGFAISDAARGLIEQASQEREAAIVVNLIPLAHKPAAVSPGQNWIPDELLDDPLPPPAAGS